MNNELNTLLINVLFRSRLYLLISTIVSIYLYFQSDIYTTVVIYMVLFSFSVALGSQDISIKLLSQQLNSSKRINIIHFDQLVDDHEILKSTYTSINEELDRPIQSLRNLEVMIEEQHHTINAIKSAMNGDLR